MAHVVNVCMLDGQLSSFDLDACRKFPGPTQVAPGRDGPTWHGAVFKRPISETRTLLNENCAETPFDEDCSCLVGAIWRDDGQDVWFVEGHRSLVLGENPTYFEVTRDDATSTLNTGGLETAEPDVATIAPGIDATLDQAAFDGVGVPLPIIDRGAPQSPQGCAVPPQRYIGDAIKELHANLVIYIEMLEELRGPLFDVRHHLELTLARSGNRVWKCIKEIEAHLGDGLPRFSLKVELAFADLKVLLNSHFERWGWCFLKEQSIQWYLDERFIRLRDTREHAYLQAAVTAVLGGRLRRHDAAIRVADKARSLGIKPDPTLSPEAAEQALWDRHNEWRNASLAFEELGEKSPEVTADELHQLFQWSDDIRPTAEQVLSSAELAEIASRGEEARDSIAGHPTIDEKIEMPSMMGPGIVADKVASNGSESSLAKSTMNKNVVPQIGRDPAPVPNHADFKTYQSLQKLSKQDLVANECRISQGTVSKRCGKVAKWLAEGNILPSQYK